MPLKILSYLTSFVFMASGFAIGADSALNLKATKTISLKKTDAAEVISVAALPQGSIVLSDWDLTKSPPDNRMELYGSDGKLIRRIGEMGKGPGKYSILRSLTVDENNVIWAADSGQHRLSRYGIDGGLIGSIISIVLLVAR